ncbi:MAG: hypothetical protein RL688_502 [Actinomycetota bacterium]
MNTTASTDTYPRQYSRTQRLSLGEPRNITISPDGQSVLFLRSRSGSDPVNCLWHLDVASKKETLIADPLLMLGGSDDQDLPPAEKARRERLREGAGGITSYSTDANAQRFTCSLGGRLFIGETSGPLTREITTTSLVFDPRLSPDGSMIGFVSAASLHVITTQGQTQLSIDPADMDESETVTWGSADFIAAEEMGRYRGFWWSPDSQHLAVCRVDNAPVQTWHIADPAHPERTPHVVRYPAAGTDNALVTLTVFSLDGATRTDIIWDNTVFPYLADVTWTSPTRLLITVQSRDQKDLVVYEVNTSSGAINELCHEHHEQWVDLVSGSPTMLDDEQLVMVLDRQGSKRLLLDGVALTPATLNVRSVISAVDADIIFMANEIENPESVSAWRWNTAGLQCLTPDGGTHSMWRGSSTRVIRSSSAAQSRATIKVHSAHGEHIITSYAEEPLVQPNVTFIRAGVRRIPCALILPRNVKPGTKLPVLMDPYGGPGHERVVDSYAAHCTSQWFADQGFAVLVVDGRGTPGLGTEWERAVYHDLATVVLEDQVDALRAVAELHPELDLTRVGIRGWSFGGYLAALAVLRRPDIFHSAIAGAPVTDWRLYDTHYTERFLGNPSVDDSPFEATSLINEAHTLQRPLLLVHGLADDNVVAAHTLQLSSALLAAGKPHEVLPLSGVTHMTPQPVVAENLLLHQLDFLRRTL